MPNSYSLVKVSSESPLFDVVIGAKSIGQVGLAGGEWRFRLDASSSWSSVGFGSEFEASELLLVERNMLEVPPSGVIASRITVSEKQSDQI